MQGLGLRPEYFKKDEFDIEVWECNAEAFYVYLGMGTQWRESFAGRTGLDYSAMPVVMDMVGVGKKRRPEVFASVRIMESVALETMAEHRNDG